MDFDSSDARPGGWLGALLVVTLALGTMGIWWGAFLAIRAALGWFGWL